MKTKIYSNNIILEQEDAYTHYFWIKKTLSIIDKMNVSKIKKICELSNIYITDVSNIYPKKYHKYHIYKLTYYDVIKRKIIIKNNIFSVNITIYYDNI